MGGGIGQANGSRRAHVIYTPAMQRIIQLTCSTLVGLLFLSQVTHAQGPQPGSQAAIEPRAYLPIARRAGDTTPPAACSTTSNNAYTTIPIEGGFYKGNALTDENADFRLSVISYTLVSAPLQLVDYAGDTDPNAPRLHGIYEPNRVPAFVRAAKRFDWNWNESGPPPYGSRGGVNDDWPVSVLDLGGAKGESVFIPERAPIVFADGNGEYHAMVLYAGERELTLTYTRNDSVQGYVVHMLNFCVDPNLVALYRAQLQNGKRATGRLPGLRNNQPVGVVLGDTVTVAVRDVGAFLDPRSRKDWWQGIATAGLAALTADEVHETGALR